MNTALDREAWLTESASMLLDERLLPICEKLGLEPAGNPWRVSVGFPPRSRGDKVLAVCTKSSASSSGHNEIFVTPLLDDSVAILAALTHELIHQLDDCESGHRGFFATLAREVGLEGPLTATCAGEDLVGYLDTIVELLGPIPHSSLNVNRAKPKQPTRLIKVSCMTCGFHFRTSERQLAKVHLTTACCPACDSNTLTTEERK